MGKLVPKKATKKLVVPSFESDIHKLVDSFVLKVQDGAACELATFKEIWKSASFSFIHQAVPVNVPARDFLQLLYASALNRLADPSPFLEHRVDPAELGQRNPGGQAGAQASSAAGAERKRPKRRPGSRGGAVNHAAAALLLPTAASAGSAGAVHTGGDPGGGPQGPGRGFNGAGAAGGPDADQSFEHDFLEHLDALLPEALTHLEQQHQQQQAHLHQQAQPQQPLLALPVVQQHHPYPQATSGTNPGTTHFAVGAISGGLPPPATAAPPLDAWSSHLVQPPPGPPFEVQPSGSAAWSMDLGPTASNHLPNHLDHHSTNHHQSVAAAVDRLFAAASSEGPSLGLAAVDSGSGSGAVPGRQHAPGLLEGSLVVAAPCFAPGPGLGEEDNYDDDLGSGTAIVIAAPDASAAACTVAAAMSSAAVNSNPAVDKGAAASTEPLALAGPGAPEAPAGAAATTAAPPGAAACDGPLADPFLGAGATDNAPCDPLAPGDEAPSGLLAVSGRAGGGTIICSLAPEEAASGLHEVEETAAAGGGAIGMTSGSLAVAAAATNAEATMDGPPASAAPAAYGSQGGYGWCGDHITSQAPTGELSCAGSGARTGEPLGIGVDAPAAASAGTTAYDTAAATAGEAGGGELTQAATPMYGTPVADMDFDLDLALGLGFGTTRESLSPLHGHSPFRGLGRSPHKPPGSWGGLTGSPGRGVHPGSLWLLPPLPGFRSPHAAPTATATSHAAVPLPPMPPPLPRLPPPGHPPDSVGAAAPPNGLSMFLPPPPLHQQDGGILALPSCAVPLALPAPPVPALCGSEPGSGGQGGLSALPSLPATAPGPPLWPSLLNAPVPRPGSGPELGPGAPPGHGVPLQLPAFSAPASSNDPRAGIALLPRPDPEGPILLAAPAAAAVAAAPLQADATDPSHHHDHHHALPLLVPTPGPDVPLSARVGAIFTLYCLYGTQLCWPAVRVYVPLPLLGPLAATVTEAAESGLVDLVAVLQDLMSKEALVPGGPARYPGATTARPPKTRPPILHAARDANIAAAGAGAGEAGAAGSDPRVFRPGAPFHDVLMSNPMLRQALLHLRTALPGLADMAAFERRCEEYGRLRQAIFALECSTGGSSAAAAANVPDTLFDPRFGRDVRELKDGLFRDVLRALRQPPSHLVRAEERRRRKREREEAEAAEAAAAAAAAVVAAAPPPAPAAGPRRRVAGELGALIARRAAAGGLGGGGLLPGRVPGGLPGPSRVPTVKITRYRLELASAGLGPPAGPDGDPDGDRGNGAAPPGVPARLLAVEAARRQAVADVAASWLEAHDRLTRREERRRRRGPGDRGARAADAEEDATLGEWRQREEKEEDDLTLPGGGSAGGLPPQPEPPRPGRQRRGRPPDGAGSGGKRGHRGTSTDRAVDNPGGSAAGGGGVGLDFGRGDDDNDDNGSFVVDAELMAAFVDYEATEGADGGDPTAAPAVGTVGAAAATVGEPGPAAAAAGGAAGAGARGRGARGRGRGRRGRGGRGARAGSESATGGEDVDAEGRAVGSTRRGGRGGRNTAAAAATAAAGAGAIAGRSKRKAAPCGDADGNASLEPPGKRTRRTRRSDAGAAVATAAPAAAVAPSPPAQPSVPLQEAGMDTSAAEQSLVAALGLEDDDELIAQTVGAVRLQVQALEDLRRVRELEGEEGEGEDKEEGAGAGRTRGARRGERLLLRPPLLQQAEVPRRVPLPVPAAGAARYASGAALPAAAQQAGEVPAMAPRQRQRQRPQGLSKPPAAAKARRLNPDGGNDEEGGVENGAAANETVTNGAAAGDRQTAGAKGHRGCHRKAQAPPQPQPPVAQPQQEDQESAEDPFTAGAGVATTAKLRSSAAAAAAAAGDGGGGGGASGAGPAALTAAAAPDRLVRGGRQAKAANGAEPRTATRGRAQAQAGPGIQAKPPPAPSLPPPPAVGNVAVAGNGCGDDHKDDDDDDEDDLGVFDAMFTALRSVQPHLPK